MKRRQAVFLSIVLLLVAANIGYWWPHAAEIPRMEPPSAARHFQVEDFSLKIPVGGDDSYARPRRDLFQPKVAVVQPSIKKTSSPTPPPKTAEQLEEESARTELAQIKLVGVVFRGDKGQAYLVRGDEAYMVFAGDKVGSRFTVETITTDAVELKDPATNVSGKIPVSGK